MGRYSLPPMLDRIITAVGRPPALLYRVVTILGGYDNDDRATSNEVLIEEVFPRVAGPPIAATLAGLFMDFGGAVSPALYGAMAQILPILALAGFVELLPALGSALRTGLEDADHTEMEEVGNLFVRMHVFAVVGNLLVGTAAALWALGADTSSTFLLVTTCASAVVMIWTLTSAHLQRYKPVLESRLSQRLDEAEGKAMK
jgi:hypothetical protein